MYLKPKEFPCGHPKKLDFESPGFDINNVFGFVKCKILSPKQLYLPVLPSRVNNKLEFVLCATCAESSNQKTCEHSDDDRCLIGTWTTAEIQKAISEGYEIKKYYEVLHYEKVSDKLFKKYIDLWLKIKQESSGWPPGCETEEQK